MAKGGEASHESLDIFYILNLAYFGDSRDLVRIHFNVVLGDDVPQKFASGDPEAAFLWIQLDVEIPEVAEGLL
jgi:hypothetical protein